MIAGEVTSDAIIVLLVAGAVLYVPGLALILAARVRLPYAVGFAPAMTAGVFALLGLLYPLAGIPWNLGTAGAGTAVVALAGGLVGRVARARTGVLSVPDDAPAGLLGGAVLSAAALVAALVLLVPMYRISPGLNSLISSFDSMFHYNAVALVRDRGDVSPFTGLEIMFDGSPTFYPILFHQVASLVPGEIVRAVNASVLVMLCSSATAMASLLWILTPASFPRWQRALIAGLLVPSVFLFFSIPFMALTVGLWPNAFASSLLPAVMAAALLTVRRVREGIARSSVGPTGTVVSALPLALIVGGAICVHPSMAFSAAVLAWCIAVAVLVRQLRTRRRLALAGLGACLAVLVVYDVVGATLLRSMAQTVKPWMSGPAVVMTMLADRPRLTAIPLKLLFVVPVYLLTLVGVVSVLRRRTTLGLALVIHLIATFVIALGAMIPFLPISSLANPWYQARERILPMFTMTAIALAAIGLAAIVPWLRRRAPALRAALGLGIAAALLAPVALTATDWMRMPRLLELSLHRDGYLVAYVSSEERDFIEESSAQIPRTAVVLGVPSDGTPMFYSLGDRSVVFPHGGYPSTPTQMLLATRGDDILTDPEVCRTLRGFGEEVYFYEDRSPFRAGLIMSPLHRQVYGALDRFYPTGQTLVAQSPDGLYRLYRLDLPC